MYLHQIFLSIENSRFEDFPTYAENAAQLRAMNPDLDYWLAIAEAGHAFWRHISSSS